MNLREFINGLYESTSEALKAIESEETEILKCHEKSVDVIYEHIGRLKEFVLKYQFENDQEEIHFFKHGKPKFTGLLIYHLTVYNIEAEKPVGLGSILKEYYQGELEKLQVFYRSNLEFHKYYRSDAIHLDNNYFLRGHFDIHLAKEAITAETDPSFSTLCDYKVAKIIANDMLVTYLNKEIANLALQENGTGKQTFAARSHISWTASKTDLIELLYGFYCIGVFNNGSIELNKIFTFFETLFNTELGNYSRFLQQMRIRKNRTAFIDKVKEKLVEYMDQLDDQLYDK